MEKRQVLDHGYVKLIDHMGSDETIIRAARMSTSKSFVSWEPYKGHPNGDIGLLAYLWKNQHTTPFEMCSVHFEIKAPIFVFRQWHRHRTQSYNETSARYTPLPDENYIPTIERMLIKSGKNKQAQSTGVELTSVVARELFNKIVMHNHKTQRLYEELLDEGLSKELARLVLPVARYSTMRASANLLNWLRFLKLRIDPHAQWEIRQYALHILDFLNQLYPRTINLFMDSNK